MYLDWDVVNLKFYVAFGVAKGSLWKLLLLLVMVNGDGKVR